MDTDTRLAAWALTDARRLARDPSGATIYLCSQAQRTQFQAGDRVDLVLLLRNCDRHGPFLQQELVWLTVRHHCQGAFLGTLDSDSTNCALLRAGDSVAFGASNVAVVHSPTPPDNPPRPPRPGRPIRLSWQRLLRLDR